MRCTLVRFELNGTVYIRSLCNKHAAGSHATLKALREDSAETEKFPEKLTEKENDKKIFLILNHF